MTPQEMIDVIQAYRDGKSVEYNNGDDIWIPIDMPTWNFNKFTYRVKPPAVSVEETKKQCAVVLAHERHQPVEWRPIGTELNWKPVERHAQIDFRTKEYRVLRPHWPCICKVGRDIFLTDSLYADVADALREVEGSGGAVIRLATEYPPVMLP